MSQGNILTRWLRVSHESPRFPLLSYLHRQPHPPHALYPDAAPASSSTTAAAHAITAADNTLPQQCQGSKVAREGGKPAIHTLDLAGVWGSSASLSPMIYCLFLSLRRMLIELCCSSGGSFLRPPRCWGRADADGISKFAQNNRIEV